jgi:hypothetical protein
MLVCFNDSPEASEHNMVLSDAEDSVTINVTS